MIRKCMRMSKVVSVIGLLNILIYMHYLTTSYRSKETCSICYQTKDERCEYKLYRQLQKVTNHILSIKSIFAKEEYEKLMEFERFIDTLVYKIQKKRERETASTMPEYSCVETYNGSTFGYPYFIKGFVRTKCNVRPLKESTSLILESPTTEKIALYILLKYATETYNTVVVILRDEFKTIIQETMSRLSNTTVNFLLIGKYLKLGEALNKALNQISSPFILVAPHLAKLDENSDIERLINVQEITQASIVGAAVKDVATGEWNRGCYQREIKAYTLKYYQGYHTSQNECLSCGHISSPFLAPTRFLKAINFGHYPAGVYRDLFLKLKPRGEIISCPDVMFYVNSYKEKPEDLVEFANSREVTRILDTDNEVLWFGHRRGLHYTDHGICNLKRTFIVPPDCRANLMDIITFILNTCTKHKILCELQEGTLLGAMKFNNILPWERDADITVLSEHFDVLRKSRLEFEKEGYKMIIVSSSFCCFEGVMSGGVMHIHGRMDTHGWTVEVYGQHKLTSHSNSRTKVRLGDQWVHTPENPGLYVRNRYGREIYNHAEHWLSTGKDSGWAFYESGAFHKCEEKGHHACLDQFKGDGDIQFYKW